MGKLFSSSHFDFGGEGFWQNDMFHELSEEKSKNERLNWIEPDPKFFKFLKYTNYYIGFEILETLETSEL